MTMITKRALPRRTFLRGTGVALALPLLDAMVPAVTALAQTAARPVRRLGVVYVCNGMAMEYWTPKTVGANFEVTPILEPLKAFAKDILVISGLSGFVRAQGPPHPAAATAFLTGVEGDTSSTGQIAATSIDQIVAHELAKETQVASLELALDAAGFSGACGADSCIRQQTISWRTPTNPQLMEPNPRVIFERLFGDSGSTEQAARLRGLSDDRSILDSVTARIADLQRELGAGDQTRLAEYLEAIRDVERRIQRAEEQSTRALPIVEQPAGIPSSFDEHAKLMYDLQVLAYQTDLTRVFTLMIGQENGGRSYPEIGVVEAHHPLSHHQYDPTKIRTYAKLNYYHVSLFAYFLEKLRDTPDGDGSLLDHVLLMYGSGMSDSNAHVNRNLPILLAGGGSGQLKGGRHLQFPGVLLANLLATVLEKVGVPIDRLESGDGKLQIDTLGDV